MGLGSRCQAGETQLGQSQRLYFRKERRRQTKSSATIDCQYLWGRLREGSCREYKTQGVYLFSLIRLTLGSLTASGEQTVINNPSHTSSMYNPSVTSTVLQESLCLPAPEWVLGPISQPDPSILPLFLWQSSNIPYALSKSVSPRSLVMPCPFRSGPSSW